MKRMVVAAVVAALGNAAFAAQMEHEMDEQEVASYFAVISCVDRALYADGYEAGDPDREALLSAALARYDLPAYDEALYRRKYEIEQDLNSYMRTYATCSANDWLASIAEQRSKTPQE